MKSEIYLIGYASGIAANEIGSQKGPDVTQRSQYAKQAIDLGVDYQWLTTIAADAQKAALESVVDSCEQVANQTAQCIKQNQKFAVIGGDHSCAIGTWSGVAAALAKNKKLGLLWIDAHLDIHTFDTSPSGNIHGMPVAALLGHGEKSLTKLFSPQPKVDPENLYMIGMRSYESDEHELVDKLNIHVAYQDSINQKGFTKTFIKAIDYLRSNSDYFGISLDVDSIDPDDAPAVSTPVQGGIHAKELLDSLKLIADDKQFVGFDIAEFNPSHDQNHKTEKLIWQIISTLTIGKTFI